jgi:hypothetical protein
MIFDFFLQFSSFSSTLFLSEIKYGGSIQNGGKHVENLFWRQKANCQSSCHLFFLLSFSWPKVTFSLISPVLYLADVARGRIFGLNGSILMLNRSCKN